MKVLFVHEGYISKNNDELYSLHYNNAYIIRYKKIADEITFLVREESFDKNKKNQNKLDVEGFRFVGLNNYKSIKGIKKYFEVRKQVESAVIETDYLVARLPGDLGNLAIRYAIKHNKKYMVELVGCPWDALWHHSLLGKFFAPVLFLKTKMNVYNAPYVVYVTKKFLQKRYPTKGVTTNISNVSIGSDSKISIPNEISSKKPIIFGTIGVVNIRYKGQEYVLRAISELKKQQYQIEYQLVGGGDNTFLKSLVKKYGLEEEVIFNGSLPHESIFQWLKNIDIYIQPSNTEGLPRALVEAMNESCICIGSNAGGIPELLPVTNIFKKGNVDDLVRVLKNAIEKGCNTVEDTFNVSKEYACDLIELRRQKFFKAFRDSTIFEGEVNNNEFIRKN